MTYVFAPLIVFLIVGLWRERRLIEDVERETLEWLATRHRAGCIDVKDNNTNEFDAT